METLRHVTLGKRDSRTGVSCIFSKILKNTSGWSVLGEIFKSTNLFYESTEVIFTKMYFWGHSCSNYLQHKPEKGYKWWHWKQRFHCRSELSIYQIDRSVQDNDKLERVLTLSEDMNRSLNYKVLNFDQFREEPVLFLKIPSLLSSSTVFFSIRKVSTQ